MTVPAKDSVALRGKLGHARVAVLTVIDEEFEAARDALGLLAEVEGTQYYVDPKADQSSPDIVLVQAIDRSNVPFKGTVDDVIEDFRPNFLLLVGIAGGLSDEGRGRDGIAVGDVIIADSVAYIEFLKLTDKKISLRQSALDHPSLHLKKVVSQNVKRNFQLARAISVARPDLRTQPKILEGQIACGEKVLGSVEDYMQKKLLEPFDKALAIDMESFGMARSVCERRTSVWYNPRYAIIRGISDMASADVSNSETRDKWKKYACAAAAEVAKEFIRRLPKE